METTDFKEELNEQVEEQELSDQEEVTQEVESINEPKYKIPSLNGEDSGTVLSGMFQNWFLDYASYVNLERSVPHINDGLKPVQRRVLFAMKRLDDGRYNKVANIVGHTMQFHPHGDASIGDALVSLQQKELLIDGQGNWGHILTGDDAAAPRYIEARLSKFALEVLFNPKTTPWKPSYDGRNEEPITLPVKFPLLLAQGTEGIGVGLNSIILPHNFNELIDAAIAYLHNEDFDLYPDFITGGTIDVSKYNNGKRGGKVRVRAKIEKLDNKTLVIEEIPFGITTLTLSQSITKAIETGKIKVRKIDDLTSDRVKILVHLLPGVSSDKTIDALYAFTKCEVSISPNCCVIKDKKPLFIGVNDVLRYNVDYTKDLLRQELEIQRSELQEKLFFSSLEKIFIEERIYKDKEYENAKDLEVVLKHIEKRLEPYKESFIREITREDLLRLEDIKMSRIHKFNSQECDIKIQSLKDSIEEVNYHLEQLTEYTITWFKGLKARYGEKHPRKTEIRNFETIIATKVVEANEKLYLNKEEGFIGIGTSLRQYEYICNCSDIDDIIVFFKDGKYKVVRIAEKLYVGKNIQHIAVFKKNDNRTIYNVVYQDGKNGAYFIKRFFVTGITRDKEYDLTQGKAGSKIRYFSANTNGEAEIIKITHKPKPRMKVLAFERDFSEIAIKGKQANGNLLTKNEILKIDCKQKGVSTLGGRQVWFDPDVLRLNYDGRGDYLGEFQSTDLVLVITKTGEYYTTNFDSSNHYEPNLLLIEKFDSQKVWSAALIDADQQGYRYIKRFNLDASDKKISFLGENPESKLLLLTCQVYPRFLVTFGGNDANREPQEIDVEEFISVKSIKAKGKRISLFEVEKIEELEPTRFPKEPTEEKIKQEEVTEKPTEKEKEDFNKLLDDITGQMTLF